MAISRIITVSAAVIEMPLTISVVDHPKSQSNAFESIPQNSSAFQKSRPLSCRHLYRTLLQKRQIVIKLTTNSVTLGSITCTHPNSDFFQRSYWCTRYQELFPLSESFHRRTFFLPEWSLPHVKFSNLRNPVVTLNSLKKRGNHLNN